MTNQSDVEQGRLPRYVAKVTDFGYSTMVAEDEGGCIATPGTPLWHAPEWAHSPYAASITEAKKMDAFSFGMVCAWLLFDNQMDAERRVIMNNTNFDKQLPILLDKLHDNSDILQQQIDKLHELFTSTLTKDPADRSIDFGRFFHLLGSKRYNNNYVYWEAAG
jgi:hypothetical protein